MKKQAIYSILFLFMSINALGWGGRTHKSLTYYSWINSDKLGNETFLLRLNLDKGMLNERLSDTNEEKTPDEWLQYGAEHEDDTDDPAGLIPDRSNFHFHNPLKEWAEAGLSDIHTGASGSAILWAQDGALQDSISNEQKDRSWSKAREYYYKALIEVEYPSWRRNYFAEMFKILGHQVHLLQDMAVPDHVRNDSHVLNNFAYVKMKNNSFRCIEGWADDNIVKVETIANYNQLKPLLDFSTSADPLAIIPIALISDTKQYKVSQTPLSGLNQGLAEYTNANYFSEDTIFTEEYDHDHKHWFPHPSKTETNVMSLGMPSSVTAEDSKKDWVKFVKKTDGENLEHLVSAGYYQNKIDKLLGIYKFSFFLSDVCHEEYASKLVPRAVGYSAALLDYFFRGEIEVSLPTSANPALPKLDGIYGFTNDETLGFQYISLMAKNITRDNEEMTSGFVTLIVSYRECTGSPFVPNPPAPGIERKYIKVEYPNAVDIPRDVPIRLDFDLSSTPLPVTAVDVNLTLVFHGFLGGEFANAVAIGFKDISEPTPVDLFNNTDLVCFNGNYVNYDDVTLWDAVDINPKNGQIDCADFAEIDITRRRIKPIYLSFNGAPADDNNYYFKYESGLEIFPGEAPHRFYVLADEYPAPLNISILVHVQSIEKPISCLSYYPNDSWSTSPYTNKLVWNNYYVHYHSPIEEFRGYPHWIYTTYENSAVPENTDCTTTVSASSFSVSDAQSKTLGMPKKIMLHPKNTK